MHARSSTRQRNFQRVMGLVALAGLLPVLPTGCFAGAVLALLIGVWIARASDADVMNRTVLWVATAAVLLENLVFAVGFLRHM